MNLGRLVAGACAALGMSVAAAMAAPQTADYSTGPFNTVDYDGASDAQIGLTIVKNGVTATGTPNLVALEGNGLGAGGDIATFGGEFLEFAFDAPASAVSYLIWSAQSIGVTPMGQRAVEAFDANGLSLGAIIQEGVGSYDLTALFMGAIISKFRLTSEAMAGFTLRSVTWEAAPAVPLPAAAPLFLAGAAGLAFARRRRKTV